MITKRQLKSVLAFSKKSAILPVTLRSRRDELKYATAKGLGLSNELVDEPRIREWKHWAIIHNEYPYSYAFKVHHMLIPKRAVKEDDLSSAEEAELKNILKEIRSDYDCRMINMPSKQTKLNHFHIHLLTFKDKREELRP